MKKVFCTFVLVFAAFALTMVAGCGQDDRPRLYFYTWSDYIDPELLKEFQQKYNCVVVQDNFDSNETLYAKLKSSNDGYDIIVPTSYMVDRLKREGLIQRLDLTKVPNAKYIDKVIAKKLNNEDFEYAMPYLLGITGIGYNAEKTGTPPDSWTIFGDEKFKGRMTMLEDIRETIGVGLLCLGYDVNSTNEAELAEARDLILKWRPNLAKFGVDDVKNGLASGEFYIVHQYSGDIMQYTADDANIRFTAPKEGALFAADNLVIPKNAPNADLAHKFIDFLCDPANCTRNMEYTQFLAPIPEAVAKLPEEMRTNAGFVLPIEEILNAKVIEDISDEDLEKYSKIWDEIKSAK